MVEKRKDAAAGAADVHVQCLEIEERRLMSCGDALKDRAEGNMRGRNIQVFW